MEKWIDILEFVLYNFIFVLTVIIFSAYVILAVFSAVMLTRYLRKNSYVDYNSIILAPLIPTISVIAPAYNESKSIVANIRALLSLYYNDFEVIVVNDGSKDDTLKKIIEAYDLERVNYFFDYRIPCKRIRGVYKSRNRSFKKLTVIDKVNGGKADSLNAGINVSKNKLVVSIDADSIMEPDALLKMVKPFLEEKGKKVIGTGGVLRIANSCEIEGGLVRRVHLPGNFLARVQVLEYTRAFLMGRMAWAKLDGLLLISGALGMFDRETMIRAGGYSTETVGEDMELVVRMRRLMAEEKVPYEVTYIPDPLCWTEVPERMRILGRQRNRWTRGTAETLWLHRKIFMNPKYGKFGMLGYTYWFFFEWLAPLVEFFGLIYFSILAVLGHINWSFFLLLLGFVYTFAVSLSIWAVLFEEMTFHKYEKRRDVFRLIGTAFLEPFFYHPLTVLWAVKGNYDFFIGKKSWGKMERTGFEKPEDNV
ncbi:MAG TPA: glycosyltransferase family 2 protein [Bacteroidetes bacterium]|nr:glycosyltransferase family 2 protein [Bacteroidota bacterium]